MTPRTALFAARSISINYRYTPRARHSTTSPPQRRVLPRMRMVPGIVTPRRTVPDTIVKPRYALTGDTISSEQPPNYRHIPIYDRVKDAVFIDRMRYAAQLAATVLQEACVFAANAATPKTTDDIDALVHYRLTELGAYPSPLNYAGFPKSVCTSVNDVICHGIPDQRFLQYGDLVSIDVSCYVQQVHGDNCATVLVGDPPTDTTEPATAATTTAMAATDDDDPDRAHGTAARRLMQATRTALRDAIAAVRPGVSLRASIGAACQRVADAHGYASVAKYRGHGIGREFHTPPFVQHTAAAPTNSAQEEDEDVILQEGMIFTIEPMFCEGSAESYEWASDGWTVATVDGGWAAQFEHTVLVTATGAEILTLPRGHPHRGRDYRAGDDI